MIRDLFDNNIRWAASHVRADPAYFRRLASQQQPEHFWIGCSDSRVPANEIVGLDPGEVFVHRNLANLAPAQDCNFLSALQFAVEVLQVRHVIVCGHYGCGGVRAALSNEWHGLIDHWLQPVRSLCWRDAGELDAITDFEARVNDACERNVRTQVASVAANPFVQDAWRRGQPLAVHGWIYSIKDGLLRDLETTATNAQEGLALVCGALPAPRTLSRRRNRRRPATTGRG